MSKKKTMLMAMLVGGVLLMSSVGLAETTMEVFASILPQKYFLEQIGKNRVAVSVMVAPGENPATYEPKPRQMAALSKARIYFAVGVPFEDAWLERIVAANPAMAVVHTDAGIKKIPMATEHPLGHETGGHAMHHGHEDRHDHGGLDPHIWLAPPLVKVQARHMLTALVAADPGAKEFYQANFDEFVHEIDALDASFRRLYAKNAGLRFMVFHPSWGYFARAYGLKQIPIEIEGKTPKPAQLKHLIEYAKAEKIRVIFVQPQFSTKSAEIIARAIGGKVVPADPLAPEWADNLRRQAENFRSPLK